MELKKTKKETRKNFLESFFLALAFTRYFFYVLLKYNENKYDFIYEFII